MKYFALRTCIIKWFEPNLSSSKFFICIENAFCEAGTLKCTIPQGSILGLLLFLLFALKEKYFSGPNTVKYGAEKLRI